jgi:hypothetical protein
MESRRQSLMAGMFMMAALGAALAPFLQTEDAPRPDAADGFPGWPKEHEGRALAEAPLTAREAEFVRGFPGRIGRFSDGKRELIIRWAREPTRRLHPAADCFRGAGYAVTPAPVERNNAGVLMGCFDAENGGGRLHVCEYVTGAGGQTWADVSAWYWSALFRPDGRGWWSYVVAEER